MSAARVQTWGRAGIGTITVRVRDGERAADAACRSLARRHGLSVAGGPCPQGTAVERGVSVADHYSATLGRWSREWQVYTDLQDVWMAVKR